MATQLTKQTNPSIPHAIPHHLHHHWTNWHATASCRPQVTFHPYFLDDLIEIVNWAREHGLRIRVAATGHSWSALVPTDEVLVVINHLHKVEMDLSDEANPRVVVEAGATNQQVNTVLERHGYALPSNVVLESVRFGGLVATGSHGSGWNNATLSDFVHSIEIVTAAGQLRKFEAGVDDDDVMNAARMNLGMFGVIYRLTLNVKKSWRVRAHDRRLPIPRVFGELKELVESHENLDLFWWPFCDQFWVKSWDSSQVHITTRPRKSLSDHAAAAVTSRFLKDALIFSEAVPRLTPQLCRLVFAATPSKRDEVEDVMDAIHYRRSIEVTRLGCVEVAFKIDLDFANVKWALQVVFDRVNAHAKRGKFPMNVTMNARFIHNSACWLSPAFGEGHTCYIEVLSRTPKHEWEPFSAEVALDWLSLSHARPHWAKQYRHIPGIVEHIRKNSGEGIRRFNQLKQQLQVDPTNMFVNAALQEVFLT